MKLVKLGAAWCQPCKMLDQVLETNDFDVQIEYIDIDASLDKAKKYNIRGVPTVVLEDDEGNELRRFVGAKNASEIREFITN